LYELERRFRAAGRELRDAGDQLADARERLRRHPVSEIAIRQYQLAREIAVGTFHKYEDAKTRLLDIDREIDDRSEYARRIRRQIARQQFLSSPIGLTTISLVEVTFLSLLWAVCLGSVPFAVWLILLLLGAIGAVSLTVLFSIARKKSQAPQLAYLTDLLAEADRDVADRMPDRQAAEAAAEQARDRWKKADDTYQVHKSRARPKALYDESLRALDEVREYYDHVRRRYEDAQIERRLRLAERRWRHLKGRDFEVFIQEVFECLGYQTELTGATGDQGIDVIASKNGVFWGIQCKGYAKPLGNGPVQEAVAGMNFYRCHRCLVITTSRFTEGGRALAKANKCVLIEGREIRALILGDLEF
jgi:HJR/Mrr/RecB family endonuclease